MTEAQQAIAQLQADIADLTQQLDEATKPADENGNPDWSDPTVEA